jgi:hypothetical protein
VIACTPRISCKLYEMASRTWTAPSPPQHVAVVENVDCVSAALTRAPPQREVSEEKKLTREEKKRKKNQARKRKVRAHRKEQRAAEQVLPAVEQRRLKQSRKVHRAATTKTQLHAEHRNMTEKSLKVQHKSHKLTTQRALHDKTIRSQGRELKKQRYQIKYLRNSRPPPTPVTHSA